MIELTYQIKVDDEKRTSVSEYETDALKKEINGMFKIACLAIGCKGVEVKLIKSEAYSGKFKKLQKIFYADKDKPAKCIFWLLCKEEEYSYVIFPDKQEPEKETCISVKTEDLFATKEEAAEAVKNWKLNGILKDIHQQFMKLRGQCEESFFWKNEGRGCPHDGRYRCKRTPEDGHVNFYLENCCPQECPKLKREE